MKITRIQIYAIIFVILISVIGFCIYYFYISKKNNNPKPTTIPTPSPTAPDTKNLNYLQIVSPLKYNGYYLVFNPGQSLSITQNEEKASVIDLELYDPKRNLNYVGDPNFSSLNAVKMYDLYLNVMQKDENSNVNQLNGYILNTDKDVYVQDTTSTLPTASLFIYPNPMGDGTGILKTFFPFPYWYSCHLTEDENGNIFSFFDFDNVHSDMILSVNYVNFKNPMPTFPLYQPTPSPPVPFPPVINFDSSEYVLFTNENYIDLNFNRPIALTSDINVAKKILIDKTYRIYVNDLAQIYFIGFKFNSDFLNINPLTIWDDGNSKDVYYLNLDYMGRLNVNFGTKGTYFLNFDTGNNSVFTLDANTSPEIFLLPAPQSDIILKIKSNNVYLGNTYLVLNPSTEITWNTSITNGSKLKLQKITYENKDVYLFWTNFNGNKVFLGINCCCFQSSCDDSFIYSIRYCFNPEDPDTPNCNPPGCVGNCYQTSLLYSDNSGIIQMNCNDGCTQKGLLTLCYASDKNKLYFTNDSDDISKYALYVDFIKS